MVWMRSWTAYYSRSGNRISYPARADTAWNKHAKGRVRRRETFNQTRCWHHFHCKIAWSSRIAYMALLLRTWNQPSHYTCVPFPICFSCASSVADILAIDLYRHLFDQYIHLLIVDHLSRCFARTLKKHSLGNDKWSRYTFAKSD